MPSAQEQSKGVVGLIKNIHVQVESVARQFPAGAQELKKAQDALKEAMVKIITEMQKPQGQGQSMGAAA